MTVHSKVASDVTGTIGTVCWTVQLVPQIIYNYRRKDCTGFPPVMMFLWAACGIPFSIYFLVSQPSIAVQVQPMVFMVLCTVSWCQALYYPPVSWPLRKIMPYVVLFFVVALAMELGFILWLKPLYKKGVTWPDLIFGVLASILLAVGLLPPYFELAKRRGRVVGINFLFLACDCSGALFSMISVLVYEMDIMGMILYAVCIFLEIGIFTSHAVWYLRFRVFDEETDDHEEDPETLSENAEKHTTTDLELQQLADQDTALDQHHKSHAEIDVQDHSISSRS